MSQLFIDKQEFSEFKRITEHQRELINGQLAGINKSLIEMVRQNAIIETTIKERYRKDE